MRTALPASALWRSMSMLVILLWTCGLVQAAEITVCESRPDWPVVFVPYVPHLDAKSLLDRADLPGSEGVVADKVTSFISWGGPADCSAEFRAAWNEEGLFLATRVRDDVVKCERTSGESFRDCDHWRVCFDLGRESLFSGQKFDQTDYIFEAVPTSSANAPMIRNVWFGGFQHQNNDEGHIFDVRTIKLQSKVSRDGYRLSAVFPKSLMRGFQAKPNYSFVFGSIWGDTDGTGRECELAWPKAKDQYYWTNLAGMGDMVLMGPDGGFGYRVLTSKANRGDRWRLIIYGVASSTQGDPKPVELSVRLRDARGNMLPGWTFKILLDRQVRSYEVTLSPQGLQGGRYQLLPSVTCGNSVWPADPWPVELQDKSEAEHVESLRRRIATLEQSRRSLAEKMADLGKRNVETAYLDSSLAALELFLGLLPYDLQQRNYAEAERKIGELEAIASQALAQAEHPDVFAGDRFRIPSAIRPDNSPVTMKDGIFLHHDRPIFLHGVIGLGRKYSLEMIHRFGFNAIAYDDSLASVVSTPDPKAAAISPKGRKSLIDLDRKMTRMGLYISHIIPTLHYVPGWVKTDPVLGRCRGHFLPFCLETPQSRELAETYYRHFLPAASEMPHALSLCLLNEPEYEAGCDDTVKLYRQWLHQKHGSIATLNGRWGTAYKSFDEIGITSQSPRIGPRYDWLVFNRTRLTQFTADLVSLAAKYDGLHRPRHMKLMNHRWRNPAYVQGGVDEEAIAGITDIIGYDGGGDPMFIDYVRSLDDQKLIFNSEGGMPYAEPRAAVGEFWEATIHGVAAYILWQWDPPWGPWGKDPSYMLQQPAGLHAVSRTSLDLQRLAPEVHAVSRTPAQVAIMDSFASRAFAYDAHVDALRKTYTALHGCQTPVRFITEQQIRRGLHQRYSLIVVPNVEYVEGDLVAPLAEYVRKGGRLVLVGTCFRYDEYGRDLKAPDLDTVVRIGCSDGRWGSEDSRLAFFDGLLRDAGIDRPFRAADAKNRLVGDVEVLWGLHEKTPVVFLASFRHTSAPCELTLAWKGKPVTGLDLISNEKVQANIRLRSRELMLLRLNLR